MLTCHKCGAAVGEEKAFCQDCGAPVKSATEARRPPPVTDFGATIIVPRASSTAVPPPLPRPPADARPPASPEAPQPMPSRAASPAPITSHAVNPTGQSRTVLYVVIGAGVLLFLILMLIALLLLLAN